MHAHLNPAVRAFWRDQHTLQVGARTSRAVVFSGLGPEHQGVLRRLGIAAPRAAGAAMSSGVATGRDREVDLDHPLVAQLLAAGVLVTDAASAAGASPLVDQARLQPDRASVGLAHGDADGGRTRMASRAQRTVTVLGAGRVGAVVARLLAAAGVGRVQVEDDAPTTAADLAPGGLGEADLGMPRGRAVERSTGHPTGASMRADLTVVAPGSGGGHGHGRADATRLMRDGSVHLLLDVVETVGVVGPLVLPGETSCLRCHDLHRTDRDPGWPRLLSVLDHPGRAGAGELTLAGTVAALGANQALSHLDGEPTDLRDATWELDLAHPFPRRRSWRSHPACGCRWPG